MAYRRSQRKFGREKNVRRAFLTHLAAHLIRDGRVRTTEARAKAIRSTVEKAVTKARRADVQTRRLLARRFGAVVVKRLVDEVGPRYRERAGGYTRITKLPGRPRDGAKMAIIEMV